MLPRLLGAMAATRRTEFQKSQTCHSDASKKRVFACRFFAQKVRALSFTTHPCVGKGVFFRSLACAFSELVLVVLRQDPVQRSRASLCVHQALVSGCFCSFLLAQGEKKRFLNLFCSWGDHRQWWGVLPGHFKDSACLSPLCDGHSCHDREAFAPQSSAHTHRRALDPNWPRVFMDH